MWILAFQTALMYGVAPGPQGRLSGSSISNLVGKRSVGNPRPLAGDGLSMRSAQSPVWSTQEPAQPAVHTLVVWAAGLSTRARAVIANRCVLWLFCFLDLLFQLPAGAAGGPPVEPMYPWFNPDAIPAVDDSWLQCAAWFELILVRSLLFVRRISAEFRIVFMSRCTSVYLALRLGCKHELFA